MSEGTEEKLPASGQELEQVVEAKLPTIQNYKSLAKVFGEIESIARDKNPWERTLDWEEEIKNRVKGTSFEPELDRFLIAARVMDLVLYRSWFKKVGEAVKMAGSKTQQEVAERLYQARNSSPETLELLEVQVEALDAAFRANSQIAGYNMGLTNGIRGMVAAMICFKKSLGERNCELYFPPSRWDVKDDIDLVVEDKKRRRKIGVSIKCQARQEILEVTLVDFGQHLEWEKKMAGQIDDPERKRERLAEIDRIGQTLDGKVIVKFPAPEKRPDLYKNEKLGFPSDYLIEKFGKFKPSSRVHV